MQLGSLLLVEDNPTFGRLLRFCLTPHCREFDHASTVAGAMEQLRTKDWDIILSDYHLPDGTGGHLFHWLQTEKTGNRTFVLMSSVPVSIPGADVPFIAKPFAIEDFLTLLQTLADAETSHQA